ncbi:MAG TPA: MauE/DoxX family redox-associated membrane protein [Thermoanaerobaculia bacterium]|nr:MauE/DoxX family redox-associated membrane protein [Thermoanaerobaculia bacterium]
MSWLTHPWLTIRVQIALGAIFLVAALPKIADPPSFAHMIYNYRLVPGSLVNAMALVMPWVEILAGLALILGVWRREAAVVCGLLILVFLAAIGVNLARGHAVDCGCFDVHAAGKSREEQLTDMKWVLLRDVGILVMVGQVLAASRRQVSPALR